MVWFCCVVVRARRGSVCGALHARARPHPDAQGALRNGLAADAAAGAAALGALDEGYRVAGARHGRRALVRLACLGAAGGNLRLELKRPRGAPLLNLCGQHASPGVWLANSIEISMKFLPEEISAVQQL